MNEPTLPVVAQSFQDRIRDRIKTAIGETLTDEEVQKLVLAGFKEAFFDPRKVRNPKYSPGAWNNHGEPEYVDAPPLLRVLVQNELQDKVQGVLQEYLEEHKEEVMAEVRKVVQEGIGLAILKAVGSLAEKPLMTLQNEVWNRLANLENPTR